MGFLNRKVFSHIILSRIPLPSFTSPFGKILTGEIGLGKMCWIGYTQMLDMRTEVVSGNYIRSSADWDGTTKKTEGITWVVPPPSNSHHQDYYIFSRGSQPRTSFATGILGGGTTQGITVTCVVWVHLTCLKNLISKR